MRNKAKLVVYKDDCFLLLKKKGVENKYSLLGGNIKKGEKPKKAALREAYEEGKVIVNSKQVKFLSASLDMDKKKLASIYYFITNDVDDYQLNEPHKFDSLDWINKAQALSVLNKTDSTILDRFVINKINNNVTPIAV